MKNKNTEKELPKPNARAAVRIMPDEADKFHDALKATGMKNISKAVKTAVFAFPHHQALAQEVENLRQDIQQLTKAVQSQSALIVALRSQDD